MNNFVTIQYKRTANKEGTGFETTFVSVDVETSNDSIVRFFGDFPKAYYRAMDLCYKSDKGITCSSSVNHFLTDVAKDMNSPYKTYACYREEGEWKYTEESNTPDFDYEFATVGYIPSNMSFKDWYECKAYLSDTPLEYVEMEENRLFAFFKNLDNNTITATMDEIQEFDKTGILGQGLVRNIDRIVQSIMGSPTPVTIDLTIKYLQREAYYRYCRLMRDLEV